jgi:hypothetical protein
MFLCGSLFVAASPAYKESLTNGVHCVSASIVGASSIAWMFLMGHTPYLLVLALIGLFDRKRWVLWIELFLLFEVFATILFYLL